MKALGLMLPALLVLNGQTPAGTTATTAPASNTAATRQLVYQFGYNTKVASSGNGTGTTTIDIKGLAPDGGLMLTGTDYWWNTVNPRQTSTCEVYSTGRVNCSKPPYQLSPLQLAVFPLLGKNFFSGLSGGAQATWKHTYTIRATFFPSASSGFAGQLYTWDAAYDLHGKGIIHQNPTLVLVHQRGSMKQQGGRYLTVIQETNIVYDPSLKLPVIVNELRRYQPQITTNRDTVEMKLIKDSANPQAHG